MRKIELGDIGIVVLWIIFAILMALLYRRESDAQDIPHVITTFEQGCIEGLDESHYRLHFSYISDGIEAFTFAMGDVVGSNVETLPYAGYVTTNTPQSFSTSQGLHDDWYVEAQSEDSPYTFNLMFTDDVGSAVLPLNTWDNTSWCEAGRYSPAAPVENAPMPIVGTNNTISTVSTAFSMSTIQTMPIVNTGMVCVVKYPELSVVCG